jgi:hypothetical protein
MLTFTTAGAGFLMRPLGGIVLGGYIDRVGRRRDLIVTLTMMAIATLLIAFTPGYATIGLVGPVRAGRACSFSEPTASLTFPYADSDLLWRYLQGSNIGWSEAQIVATSGLPSSTVVQDFANTTAPMHKPIDANCPCLSSPETFNATSDPKGVRCDFFDHNVNLFGKDSATGYARRTIDNVRVQYGLAALNAGAITKTQFLDLNANIGGFDNNGSYSASRAVAVRRH